ncbi:MAG TPA: TonB-dependent receptor [Longimicrobiales bacterium]|nr:TonB-dependent receptor [Longimicrobiales bacterium]
MGVIRVAGKGAMRSMARICGRIGWLVVLLLLSVLASVDAVYGQATLSWGSISGRLVDDTGVPVSGGVIGLDRASETARSDDSGIFTFPRLPPGAYELQVTAAGYAPRAFDIVVRPGATTEVEVGLTSTFELEEISVTAGVVPGSTTTAPDVFRGLVLAGTSNTIIRLQGLAANLVEKTPRQIFARVPGVLAYDMDGSGNQVNIATRGLDPHRSWELNVRQDGVLLNSDLYGYPASHYSPPMEAIDQVEVIRGTAALQYGSQYGGLVNYVTKGPRGTGGIGGESSNTVGSFGLWSTYNAVGGHAGPLTYYGYWSERRSGGYRQGAESDYSAQLVSATLRLSPTTSLRGQVGRSVYDYRIPGPLTDAQFEADPRQPTRSRNYYRPDITVPSLTFEWQRPDGAQLTTTLSGVFGPRESVQFLGFADTPDEPDSITDEYAPRVVDIDRFRSLSLETRLVRPWTLRGLEQTLAVGTAFARNHMTRQQQGVGTTGSDFDLTVAGGFPRDISYKTVNGAFYLENLFRVSPRWTITPGVRVEVGTTKMEGQLAYYDPSGVPTEIDHRYPLLGVRTAFDLRDGTELYGGWSQAYRPQILKDVLPANALERTEPELQDSRGWTVEAGARGNFAQWFSFDVNVFEMRIGDRFGTVLGSDASGSYLLRTNVGESRTRGVEVSLEAWLAQTSDFALWVHTATSFYDGVYLEGTVASGGENVDIAGSTLESVPRWISRSGVSLEAGRVSANVLVSHVSESFADPLNTVVASANGAVGLVPAYTVADVHAGLELAEWLSVRGGISNLFDRQYFTKRPQFYPGPGVWPSDGRSLQVSVVLSRW